jgi:hypothetical protein
MNVNILTLASDLSDQDLLTRLLALAGKERETSVELVAHLAALDLRPSAYAALGYGSLFGYCTEALRLSEDAACTRIHVARACRRFPVILDALLSGEMSLTAVRMLSPHLTPENHDAALARARRRSLREIEALVAELAPRPDVPSSVRRLPVATPPAAAAETCIVAPPDPPIEANVAAAATAAASARTSSPPPHRPIIETTSPDR